MKPNKTVFLINGLIQIVFSMYWIWENGLRLYQQKSLSILFIVMFPDWMLVLNIVFGTIGLHIGVLTLRSKVSLVKGYTLIFTLFIIGFIIKMIL